MNRIRVVVVVLAMLVLACTTTSATGPIKFGVKAGWSFAKQTWEYARYLGTVERDQRTGLAAGLFADMAVTPAVGLRGEFLYVQKGNQVEVPYRTYAGPAGTLTFKDRIDYLSIVATGKLNLTRQPVGVYLLAGPRLDIKLSTSSDIDSPATDSLIDSYKATVPGLTFGGGLEKTVGSFGTVLLEFRYDYDFADAIKYVGTENGVTIKNDGFQVLAGLRF